MKRTKIVKGEKENKEGEGMNVIRIHADILAYV